MPDGGLPSLALVADLAVEVGDERGSTSAHLSTDGHGLVLEVADPATLLRCVPGRELRGNLPFSLPVAEFANIPLRLTSGGIDLGRMHLTSAGRVRLRPTWSGVPVLARTVVTLSPIRPGTAVAVAGLVILAYLLRRPKAS